ncbi:sterol desaturase family protein [Haliscomenobacter hydrossis]|uniref:Fatty acid hydroxylase n=1 Tax=Haliscomenobacter hydrossis (strain ATCC 27775 / DSM 1100 / LMG 10767 / O) TaxID=760192 RepID=F4L2V7_HALH1|nr:sterol desaturase family protein [Haliscomenobacter hydrossis]AEE49637.1 fatty acid hydroxylase [Haliscomenobacter hydrossis DSM 1100]
MPTPIQILLDPISLSIIAMYALLMIYEAIFPARPLPEIKFWRLKGILAFFVFFYLSTYLPLLCADFLPQKPLLDLSGIGVLGGSIAGVLLYEFGLYLWHRAMHSNDLLWRTFHQMHHSAERLDTYGAFFFSPLDMIGFTALGTLCLSIVLGLPPQSVTVFLLVTNFFSIFQHANIRTPQWLGYLIQRPESHGYHHAQNIHQYNYSDLPIFDIIFGTFHNPRTFEHENGFYPGASERVADMLMFKDISKQE